MQLAPRLAAALHCARDNDSYLHEGREHTMVNIGELMSPDSRGRIERIIRDQTEREQASREDEAWIATIEEALKLAENEEGEDDE